MVLPIIAVIAVVAMSAAALSMLWFLRLGALLHWSYIMGRSIYPDNMQNSFMLSVGLFSFFFFGKMIPDFLVPGFATTVTALSILPQIHILYLLYSYDQDGKKKKKKWAFSKPAVKKPPPKKKSPPRSGKSSPKPASSGQSSQSNMDEEGFEALVRSLAIKAYAGFNVVSIVYTVITLLL